MSEEQEATSHFKMHVARLVLVWSGSHWCQLKVDTTLTTLFVIVNIIMVCFIIWLLPLAVHEDDDDDASPNVNKILLCAKHSLHLPGNVAIRTKNSQDIEH